MSAALIILTVTEQVKSLIMLIQQAQKIEFIGPDIAYSISKG